jgi:glycosyltransferase involved in cell wall biosynthesis
MKTLVIVPAYNEESCITGVVRDLEDNFPEGDILVVNDGSLDRTSEVANALGVWVIDLPYNVGIGGAVQTGLLYALAEGYDAAIQFDGDGQHMADEIQKILSPYKKGDVDLVVGSRFLSEGGFASSLQRRLGAKILSFVVSTLIGKRITDTTSGFRVYGRKAIDFFSSQYPEDYPEVEAFILAHKKGLRIEEVPAEILPRASGKSSITTTRAVYYMAKVLLAVFVDLIKKID